jgi:hypothetical protein
MKRQRRDGTTRFFGYRLSAVRVMGDRVIG